jgi:hypothetical protein
MPIARYCPAALETLFKALQSGFAELRLAPRRQGA